MQKLYLPLLTFLWASQVLAFPIQEHALPPVQELSQCLGIPADVDIITVTQKEWLRKPGQERWEQNELPPEKRACVLDWAKKAGLFSPWLPTLKLYDKALILGATTPRMEERLTFLKELWCQGVRFKEVVWLTGERPLDERVDTVSAATANESEAAMDIWRRADLPEEMRQLPVRLIAVPMKEGGKRPNTQDTIVAWVQTTKAPVSGLFISDQPFCGYQYAIIKGTVPASFPFEVVGQGVDPESHPAAASIVLDSLARWLYQESL